MLSLLIPLIILGVLLFLNGQRARLRPPAADTWAATREDDAPEAAIARFETPAMLVASPPAVIEIAPSTPVVPVRHGRPNRYLLDGDDPAPRAVDRVAALQHHMRKRGICSPR